MFLYLSIDFFMLLHEIYELVHRLAHAVGNRAQFLFTFFDPDIILRCDAREWGSWLWSNRASFRFSRNLPIHLGRKIGDVVVQLIIFPLKSIDLLSNLILDPPHGIHISKLFSLVNCVWSDNHAGSGANINESFDTDGSQRHCRRKRNGYNRGYDGHPDNCIGAIVDEGLFFFVSSFLRPSVPELRHPRVVHLGVDSIWSPSPYSWQD
mmetsp:Transcript_35737/g.83137  ORF Transcript_35737/g.83137 Transcript_35737/m.83137 type:complete len:208 (-) Transcript_35737:179-802(-)